MSDRAMVDRRRIELRPHGLRSQRTAVMLAVCIGEPGGTRTHGAALRQDQIKSLVPSLLGSRVLIRNPVSDHAQYKQ